MEEQTVQGCDLWKKEIQEVRFTFTHAFCLGAGRKHKEMKPELKAAAFLGGGNKDESLDLLTCVKYVGKGIGEETVAQRRNLGYPSLSS